MGNQIDEMYEARAENDTREKLEADAMHLSRFMCATEKLSQANVGKIIGLLDRQAVITARECRCPGYEAETHRCRYHDQDFELNDATVSRLKRENAMLKRELEDKARGGRHSKLGADAEKTESGQNIDVIGYAEKIFELTADNAILRQQISEAISILAEMRCMP